MNVYLAATTVWERGMETGSEMGQPARLDVNGIRMTSTR